MGAAKRRWAGFCRGALDEASGQGSRTLRVMPERAGMVRVAPLQRLQLCGVQQSQSRHRSPCAPGQRPAPKGSQETMARRYYCSSSAVVSERGHPQPGRPGPLPRRGVSDDGARECDRRDPGRRVPEAARPGHDPSVLPSSGRRARLHERVIVHQQVEDLWVWRHASSGRRTAARRRPAVHEELQEWHEPHLKSLRLDDAEPRLEGSRNTAEERRTASGRSQVRVSELRRGSGPPRRRAAQTARALAPTR